MTVAVDVQTGKVIGQFIDRQPGIRTDGKSNGMPMIVLLDAEGYKTVSAWSVRLEKV